MNRAREAGWKNLLKNNEDKNVSLKNTWFCYFSFRN